MLTSSITKKFHAKNKEYFNKLKEEIEESSEPREIKELQSLEKVRGKFQKFFQYFIINFYPLDENFTSKSSKIKIEPYKTLCFDALSLKRKI